MTGKIYWGDNSTLPGKVMEGNRDGTGLRLVTTTVLGGRVHYIAVDPGAGMVYWSDSNQGTIYRADIGTGVRTSIPSLTTQLRGIALDLRPSSPNLYYYNGVSIYKANLDGANAVLLPNAIGDGGATGAPGQFALDTCNDKIYVVGITDPHPGVPVPYVRSANLSDGSGLVTILSGDVLVGNAPADIALDLHTRTMCWTSKNNSGLGGQVKSANMDTGGGLAVLPVTGGPIFSGIALCLPDYSCPTDSSTVFANKDFQNNTGQTVNGMEWLVQGTYASVISHYDGPYPGQPNSTFSSFSIVPAGANTLLRWSGGASIPNGGLAHVGFTVPGASLTTLGASWTAGGIFAGCVHQVSVGEGFSHVAGDVVFRNTAMNCESQVLYVGNIRLEWFSTMVPLADLSINGVRRPLRADDISSPPVAIAPGGSAAVKVPLPPPGARFAMIRYTVSANSTLAGPGNTIDYQEVRLKSLTEGPAITLQPQSQTGTVGDNVTFSVAATGASPLSYLWSFNNTNIPGATSANYTILNAQMINAGTYDVTVSNASGSMTSTPARLTMKKKFAIAPNPDGTLTLSWPLEEEGWILQESPSLFGPWSISASQGNPVNLRPAGSNKFYRLVKP